MFLNGLSADVQCKYFAFVKRRGGFNHKEHRSCSTATSSSITIKAKVLHSVRSTHGSTDCGGGTTTGRDKCEVVVVVVVLGLE